MPKNSNKFIIRDKFPGKSFTKSEQKRLAAQIVLYLSAAEPKIAKSA